MADSMDQGGDSGRPEFSGLVSEAFLRLVDTIAKLRSPGEGCPWDLKQTHESLRRYMLEEAYEASEAMMGGDPQAIADELGDVLLQVVLNAQVARDQGTFSILDVINAIDEKMKKRHPHVFSKDSDLDVSDKALRQRWEEIKSISQNSGGRRSLFSDAGKSRYPATTQALKIGRIAENINFDWDSLPEVFAQLESEVAEAKEEVLSEADSGFLKKELGDIYFTLAQVCRHCGLDPEAVAQGGNLKFLDRFSLLEELADAEGVDLRKSSMDKKEELWQSAKLHEKKKKHQPSSD